jgi:hypothetical protein
MAGCAAQIRRQAPRQGAVDNTGFKVWQEVSLSQYDPPPPLYLYGICKNSRFWTFIEHLGVFTTKEVILIWPPLSLPQPSQIEVYGGSQTPPSPPLLGYPLGGSGHIETETRETSVTRGHKTSMYSTTTLYSTMYAHLSCIYCHCASTWHRSYTLLMKHISNIILLPGSVRSSRRIISAV